MDKAIKKPCDKNPESQKVARSFSQLLKNMDESSKEGGFMFFIFHDMLNISIACFF